MEKKYENFHILFTTFFFFWMGKLMSENFQSF
jgi:hypothetical protein